MDFKLSRLVNKQDILSRSQSVKEIQNSFIYFLIKNDEIVYVGKTKDGIFRIKSHIPEKDFDRFSLLPCNRHDLETLEALYIIKYSPKYNSSTLPPNDLYWSKGKIKRNLKIEGNAINRIIKHYNLPSYFCNYYSSEQFKIAFESAKKDGIIICCHPYSSDNAIWYINTSRNKAIKGRC